MLFTLCWSCICSERATKAPDNKHQPELTPQKEAIMKNEEECQFLRLLPDGSLVVKLRDSEQQVKIHGIEVSQPLPELYSEIITQRIPRLRKPLRCIVQSKGPASQAYAKVFYYGWQDKSGDVWIDLAVSLLDEGLVRVTAGDFPEREEYLQHEHEARTKGVGIWSGKGR